MNKRTLTLAILALAAVALWQRKRLADAAWRIVWALRREDARQTLRGIPAAAPEDSYRVMQREGRNGHDSP